MSIVDEAVDEALLALANGGEVAAETMAVLERRGYATRKPVVTTAGRARLESVLLSARAPHAVDRSR